MLPAPGDAFDETPAPCLTGCGDGAPVDAGDTAAGSGGSGAAGGAGPVGPGPLPIGGELRPPRKLHNVLPIYPEAARRAGFGGVVVVQCVIDVTGAVVEARVLSGHPLLDDAALDAVRRWRYEPTRLNGSPVPVVMTVTVTFQARR